MDKPNSSPKCLVCFCLIRSERTKQPEEFTIVFDIFCRLLKVDLTQPMQWNFEQDHIPFCEFCSSAVEKLKGLHDQIASLQQQTTNILNRIKHEMQTSGSEANMINELTANNRVNYFRRLVVGDSYLEGNSTQITDVTSLNVCPMIQVATELGRQNSIEIPLLKGIIESRKFDDADMKTEPLLTVKKERDGTSDYVFDVESFPQDNMESQPDSLFQVPNDPAFSVHEFDIGHEKKLETDEERTNCDKCDGLSFSKNDFIVHQKQVHGNQIPKNSERKLIIELTRIDLSLNQFDSIGKKSGVQHGKNNVCSVIGKGFPSSEEFNGHKRPQAEHVREKPFNCDVCNKQFRRSQQLTVHKRTHTDERHYKCDVCNKTLSTTQSLSIHQRIHTGERPYKCEVCNKTFTQSIRLTFHKRIHTGERPYKCEVCNKSFIRSIALTYHKRTHTGERPYKCDACNKTFSRSRALTIHKVIHTGEKPYKCEVCFKDFSYGSSLSKHRKLHTDNLL